MSSRGGTRSSTFRTKDQSFQRQRDIDENIRKKSLIILGGASYQAVQFLLIKNLLMDPQVSIKVVQASEKRVLVHNLLYGNEIFLHAHCLANRTHFHVKVVHQN